ncbi:hypothetical protein [Streptomyces sp. NPDC056105]|uniref:hypothetical protein n=1 Tax=Streptomyces sp. NPDC056105 TaxID=3345714 RepID=UPI0035D763C2
MDAPGDHAVGAVGGQLAGCVGGTGRLGGGGGGSGEGTEERRVGDSRGGAAAVQGRVQDEDRCNVCERPAFGNIDSPADAIGVPGDRSLAQRLDSIGSELGDVKGLLRALVRAQGIGADTE